MQVIKFRKIFEHAKNNSRFYKEFYGDHGVLDLKIKSFADIGLHSNHQQVDPQAIQHKRPHDVRYEGAHQYPQHQRVTGEPFKIAFSKYEDYTAHIRVFWALRKSWV